MEKKKEFTIDELKLKLYEIIESMNLKEYNISISSINVKPGYASDPFTNKTFYIEADGKVKEEKTENDDLAINIEPVEDASDKTDEEDVTSNNTIWFDPFASETIDKIILDNTKENKNGIIFSDVDERKYGIESLSYASSWAPGKPLGKHIPYILKSIIGSMDMQDVINKLSISKTSVSPAKSYIRDTLKDFASPYIDKEILIEGNTIIIDENGEMITKLVRSLPTFNRKDCALMILNSISIVNGTNAVSSNAGNIVRILEKYFVPQYHLIDTSPNAVYKATEKEMQIVNYFTENQGQQVEYCRKINISPSTIRSRSYKYFAYVREIITEMDKNILDLKRGYSHSNLFNMMKMYYSVSDAKLIKFIKKIINTKDERVLAFSNVNYSLESSESAITKYNRIGGSFLSNKASEIEKILMKRYFIDRETMTKISRDYRVCVATVSRAIQFIVLSIVDKFGDYNSTPKEDRKKNIDFLIKYFDIDKSVNMEDVLDYMYNTYIPEHDKKSIISKNYDKNKMSSKG